jgi:hypothetical protein
MIEITSLGATRVSVDAIVSSNLWTGTKPDTGDEKQKRWKKRVEVAKVVRELHRRG